MGAGGKSLQIACKFTRMRRREGVAWVEVGIGI